MVKKLIIKKLNHTYNPGNSSSSYSSDSHTPITRSTPARSVGRVSQQDSMTKSQIKEHLKDYKMLNKNNLAYLSTLPQYTKIKYFNTDLQKFRVGGMLLNVDKDLEYIMLWNPFYKKKWKVLMSKSIVFVPNPDAPKQPPKPRAYNIDVISDTDSDEVLQFKLLKMFKRNELSINKPDTKKEKKEKAIKDKLYDLYINKRLQQL